MIIGQQQHEARNRVVHQTAAAPSAEASDAPQRGSAASAMDWHWAVVVFDEFTPGRSRQGILLELAARLGLSFALSRSPKPKVSLQIRAFCRAFMA